MYVGLGGTGKSLYERTTYEKTGQKEHVHFIYAGGAHGGNAFALRVITEGGPANRPPRVLASRSGRALAVASHRRPRRPEHAVPVPAQTIVRARDTERWAQLFDDYHSNLGYNGRAIARRNPR